MEAQADFKRRKIGRGMCGLVVGMLEDVQIIVPLFAASKVSSKSMNQDLVHHFCLAIRLRMECYRKLDLETR